MYAVGIHFVRFFPFLSSGGGCIIKPVLISTAEVSKFTKFLEEAAAAGVNSQQYGRPVSPVILCTMFSMAPLAGPILDYGVVRTETLTSNRTTGATVEVGAKITMLD